MRATALLLLALIGLSISSPGPTHAADPCTGAASAGVNSWNSVVSCADSDLGESGDDASGSASSASTTTYVYDPLCQANDGIVQDTAFGCAGQFQCGDNGLLHDVTAVDPTGNQTGLGAYCIEPSGPVTTTVPVLTPGRILEAFRRIPLPDAPLEIQPPGGETLVNFDTILHTDAEPFTKTVQLLGRPISFDISPVSFTWALGDGESMTTADPGRPWARGVPMERYVSHRYTQAGPVRLSLTTTWGARWRLGNGPWRDVDGTVTMTSPTQDLQVRTAQPQLVSYD